MSAGGDTTAYCEANKEKHRGSDTGRRMGDGTKRRNGETGIYAAAHSARTADTVKDGGYGSYGKNDSN